MRWPGLGSQLPIQSATQVCKQGEHCQKIIRRKEELKWWYIETRRCVVEVSVEAKYGAPEENGANMIDEEKHEIPARTSLQPGHESLPLPPATN
jgi:alpha-beta hydrolase superfamily lysophospholipase